MTTSAHAQIASERRHAGQDRERPSRGVCASEQPVHVMAPGESVAITATLATGETVELARWFSGAAPWQDGGSVFVNKQWHRWSCPWRGCPTTVLWRVGAERPATCGRCGRSLDRGCVRCATLVWFAPDDASCRICGGALTSTLTVARVAA